MLADDIGIACENTAKWLHEYDRERAGFTKDQLVIVDEASLASTHSLDRLAAIAAEAGAKLLLVGDWAQLQSVDAGGAFALLAAARDDTPELRDIHRFTNAWEKTASLELRDGRVEAIGAYARHDRLREGASDDMIDAAYLAWRADSRAGLASVLVTESSAAVSALNARARAERILDGDTAATREAVLAEGARASVGDLVITRQNERRLRSLRGGWSATVTDGRSPMFDRTVRSSYGVKGTDGQPPSRSRRGTPPSTLTLAMPSPRTVPKGSPSILPTSSSLPPRPVRTSMSP